MALAVALMALSLPSCVISGDRCELVDLRTENHSIELGDAESVVIDVDMGIGELVIRSGAKSLAELEFAYNVAEWRPEVSYEVVGGKGRLFITQPDAKGQSASAGARNEWKLSLTEDVPLEINVDMGVGEATLTLGDLMLTDLEVDHGVGDVTIDLSGSSIGDMTGVIDGGIGSITVVVPSAVGVRIDADTGIGSFNACGLKKSGNSLVNDAYDETDSTIRLSIDAGIGKITVETDEASVSI